MPRCSSSGSDAATVTLIAFSRLICSRKDQSSRRKELRLPAALREETKAAKHARNPASVSARSGIPDDSPNDRKIIFR